MTTYTKVAKPGPQTYTKLVKDPTNLPEYGVAKYGINKYGQINSYTKIAKPTGTTYTKVLKPT